MNKTFLSHGSNVARIKTHHAHPWHDLEIGMGVRFSKLFFASRGTHFCLFRFCLLLALRLWFVPDLLLCL